MENWKRQGSLNQSSQKLESFSVSNLTVSNKAIISELEINDLQILGNSISCQNLNIDNNIKVNNNILVKNNIYSKKNLIVDNEIISKKLKVVDDAIVNNLLINNNLKINRNFIVKSGAIKALEGEIISNNNIKSINGSISTENGNIISNNFLLGKKCIIGDGGIKTSGSVSAVSLVLQDTEEKAEKTKLIVDGNIYVKDMIYCNDIKISKKEKKNLWLHLNNFFYVENNIIPSDKESIVLSSIVPSTYIIKSADDESFKGTHTYRFYSKIKGHSIRIAGLEADEKGIYLGGSSTLFNNEFNTIKLSKFSFIELQLVYWDGEREFEKKWVVVQNIDNCNIKLEYNN